MTLCRGGGNKSKRGKRTIVLQLKTLVSMRGGGRQFIKEIYFKKNKKKNNLVHSFKKKLAHISVIQKESFRSPPTTHRGSVLCQLRPEPTTDEPITTGWNDKVQNETCSVTSRHFNAQHKHSPRTYLRMTEVMHQ